MPKTGMRHTVQMSILSTLLALVAFSFLAVGGASAHTLSQTRNSTHTASSVMTSTVHIRPTANGSFAIIPNAITVKRGTTVTIINSTKVRQIVFSIDPEVFLLFPPVATRTVIPQVNQELLQLYNTQTALIITIED